MACTNGCCSSSSELTTPLAVICPPGSEVTFSHWAIEPDGLTRTFMHTTWLSPTRLAPAKTSMLMICWSPTLSPGSPRSTSVKPTVLPVQIEVAAVAVLVGVGGARAEGEHREGEQGDELLVHGADAPCWGARRHRGHPRGFTPERGEAASAS